MRIEDGHQIYEQGEVIIIQAGDEWRYPKLEGYKDWREFEKDSYGERSTVPTGSCQYRRRVLTGLEAHFI